MNRNIVITGANRGIGLALAKHYQQAGDNVFAVCRQGNGALSDLGVKVVDAIDVGNPADVAKLAETLRGTGIDILINNAGAGGRQELGSIDYDSVINLFNVNALGPLRVTEALISQLAEGGKVALITSRMGSIADNTSGGTYGYRMSKTALNAAGKSLAIDLRAQGIAVAILHPGYVQTDMTGGGGDINPEVSAERMAQRIEELNIDNSGTFWHSNGDVLPW